MFVHAFTAGSLFMIAGYVQQQAGTTEIAKLRGLRRHHAADGGAAGRRERGAPWRSHRSRASSPRLLVIAGGIAANSYTAVIDHRACPDGRLSPLDDQEGRPLTRGPERYEVTDMSWPDAGILALYFVPLLVLIVFSSLILTPAAPVAQWAVHLVGGA